MAKVKVAVVQGSGPFLDRAGCVEVAVKWIEEAGREGVELLGFPEGFIPGHPVWYHFHAVTGKQSLEWAARLFENAVELGGPETAALKEAARRARLNVVIGVCEKRPATNGTMFNSQLFISSEGELLGARQKLVPTLGERIVHTPGWGDMLPVFETPIGRISGLLCGENSNTLATSWLAAQGTQIHVAGWPNHFSTNGKPMPEVINFNTLALSYQVGCFVLNACGVITDDLRRLMPRDDHDRAFLANPLNGGGASIISATSRVLAGPMPGDEQGLLMAEIDTADCYKAKVLHDYSGHYNRPDVFTLTVRSPTPVLARREAEANGSSIGDPAAAGGHEVADDDGGGPAPRERPRRAALEGASSPSE